MHDAPVTTSGAMTRGGQPPTRSGPEKAASAAGQGASAALLAGVLALTGALVGAAPAPAANNISTLLSGATPVAAWDFSTATTADPTVVDTIGGRNGTLSGNWSPAVGPNNAPGAVAFNDPSMMTVNPDPVLNPGFGDFAIRARVRVTGAVVGSPNITQRGYYYDSAQYKMQIEPDNGGTLVCRLKGSRGTLMLSAVTPILDGLWHTVTCGRRYRQLFLLQDGVTVAINSTARIGDITSSRPLVAGAKYLYGVDPDQFPGEIARLEYITLP